MNKKLLLTVYIVGSFNFYRLCNYYNIRPIICSNILCKFSRSCSCSIFRPKVVDEVKHD